MVTSFLFKRFSHPWMPTATYAPLGAVIVTLSLYFHPRPAVEVLVYIASGILAWTFVEYVLHRFVFHWTEVREPWKTLASGLHMAHHVSTKQGDLIVAPPAVSLIFATLFYLIFALVSRSSTVAALVESGVFLGFIVYEWVHYGSHRFHPKSRVGQYLRKYHLQHHHKNPDRQFGVTTPIWDFVFRTR